MTTEIIDSKSVAKWMEMDQDQVHDCFHHIPSAFSDGKNQYRYTYIPGTRDDRVLMIAHADTVWPGGDIKLGIKHDTFFSVNQEDYVEWKDIKKKGVGIGADDRAGCAILWALRKLGHSILITSGEEIGCKTSRWLASDDHYWSKELNNHNFAIQFDRAGMNDIVFYEVGTKKFVDFMEKQTGYITRKGRNTDVAVVCKTICGVNMSTGYYNEHTSREILVLPHWLNTLATAYNLLSQKNLPKFELDKTDIHRIPTTHTAYHNRNNNNYIATNPKYKQVYCDHCRETVLEGRYLETGLLCPTCHGEL